MISIHAPAWGATPQTVGGVGSSKFQSTHPRGVRPYGPILWAGQPRDFNPRTRVGCDFSNRGKGDFDGISIHAPAWGATAKVYKIICKKK